MSEIHIPPPRERGQHGKVERLAEQIADSDGAIGLPFRSIDILAALERRGRITSEMRAAGETFRDEFYRARKNALRAADVARPPGGYQGMAGPGYAAVRASERLRDAIDAVGGLMSDNGSCCFHVIGLEESLKKWGEHCAWRASGRPLTQAEARTVLCGALEVLASHYETPRRRA